MTDPRWWLYGNTPEQYNNTAQRGTGQTAVAAPSASPYLYASAPAPASTPAASFAPPSIMGQLGGGQLMTQEAGDFKDKLKQMLPYLLMGGAGLLAGKGGGQAAGQGAQLLYQLQQAKLAQKQAEQQAAADEAFRQAQMNYTVNQAAADNAYRQAQAEQAQANWEQQFSADEAYRNRQLGLEQQRLSADTGAGGSGQISAAEQRWLTSLNNQYNSELKRLGGRYDAIEGWTFPAGVKPPNMQDWVKSLGADVYQRFMQDMSGNPNWQAPPATTQGGGSTPALAPRAGKGYNKANWDIAAGLVASNKSWQKAMDAAMADLDKKGASYKPVVMALIDRYNQAHGTNYDFNYWLNKY